MRINLSFFNYKNFFLHGPHGCGRFRLLFHISRVSNLCNSCTVSNNDRLCLSLLVVIHPASVHKESTIWLR